MGGGLLAYAILVVVTCWASLRTTSVEAGDQRRPVEEAPKTTERSTPEETILNAIRTKGRAKRQDLLPLVNISKSTLVRLLDKMETHQVLGFAVLALTVVLMIWSFLKKEETPHDHSDHGGHEHHH